MEPHDPVEGLRGMRLTRLMTTRLNLNINSQEKKKKKLRVRKFENGSSTLNTTMENNRLVERESDRSHRIIKIEKDSSTSNGTSEDTDSSEEVRDERKARLTKRGRKPNNFRGKKRRRFSISKIEKDSSTSNETSEDTDWSEEVHDERKARLTKRGRKPNINLRGKKRRRFSISKSEKDSSTSNATSDSNDSGDEVHDKRVPLITNDLSNKLIDDDYMWYVNFLKEKGESWASRREEEDEVVEDMDEGDIEDDTDPQYKIFLQNLRKDGTSYILDITGNNEKSVYIKYEEYDSQAQSKKGSKCVPVPSVSHEPTRNNMPSSPPKGYHVVDDGLIDECYRQFLESLRNEGNCLVLEDKDGKRMTFQHDNENSDSEINILDTAPFREEENHKALVPSENNSDTAMDGDDLMCLGCSNESSNSLFRKKLMDLLKTPYNQREYEALLEAVKEQKPMTGYRELRGALKPFKSVTCSKSYLDHYSDLKKKLDGARLDRRKVLNILRGFFYWLENLSQDGAFCPWLDKLCLEVLPRNV